MGICSAVTSSVVSGRLARNIKKVKKNTLCYPVFIALNITEKWGFLLMSFPGGVIWEWLLLQRPLQEKFFNWKWPFVIKIKIWYWRLSEVRELHGESVPQEGDLYQGTRGDSGLAWRRSLASDRYEGCMRWEPWGYHFLHLKSFVYLTFDRFSFCQFCGSFVVVSYTAKRINSSFFISWFEW